MSLCSYSARDVADLLTSLIKPGSKIALPGGSTPTLFLPYLKDVLHDVIVIPTDERCVPDDHPDSNVRFLKSYAGDCVCGMPDNDSALFPLDLAIIGMGTDGHIASLFPGYDPANEHKGQNIVSVPAPTHIAPHVARTGLTLQAILNVKTCVLVFAGRQKYDLWQSIINDETEQNLPASLLLAHRDLIVCHIND